MTLFLQFTCEKLLNENKMLKTHTISLENNSRTNNFIIRELLENMIESNLECEEKTRKFMINELKLDDDRVKKKKFIRVAYIGWVASRKMQNTVDRFSFASRTRTH